MLAEVMPFRPASSHGPGFGPRHVTWDITQHDDTRPDDGAITDPDDRKNDCTTTDLDILTDENGSRDLLTRYS